MMTDRNEGLGKGTEGIDWALSRAAGHDRVWCKAGICAEDDIFPVKKFWLLIGPLLEQEPRLGVDQSKE